MRKQSLSGVLTFVLAVSLLGRAPLCVQAAKPVLTLSMAKASGLASSPKMEKLESELSVKEVSLQQALKSIKVKKKNKSCKVRSEVNFPSSFFDCDMRDKSVPADQRKEDGMVLAGFQHL